jgi:hypothetical protein
MIQLGDTVTHPEKTLIDRLPMTVLKIEGDKAYCGYKQDNGQIVGNWYNSSELTVIPVNG